MNKPSPAGPNLRTILFGRPRKKPQRTETTAKEPRRHFAFKIAPRTRVIHWRIHAFDGW
jgi:hypothetical protein